MRAYPTVKDTPNRKQRKGLRKKIFIENSMGEGRRKRRAEERAGRQNNAA